MDGLLSWLNHASNYEALRLPGPSKMWTRHSSLLVLIYFCITNNPLNFEPLVPSWMQFSNCCYSEWFSLSFCHSLPPPPFFFLLFLFRLYSFDLHFLFSLFLFTPFVLFIPYNFSVRRLVLFPHVFIYTTFCRIVLLNLVSSVCSL